VWQTLLAPLAARLDGEAAVIARGLSEAIRVRVPELVPSEETFEQQVASATASIRDIARLLAAAQDPTSASLPAESVLVGQAAARRQIGVTPLVRTYRLGHELLVRWMLDGLKTVDSVEDVLTAVGLFTQWSYAYIDTASSRAEELYEAERDAWIRSANFARAEAVADIVAGTERDLERASSRLRYDVRRHHLAVVAWSDTADPDAQVELARVLNPLAALLATGPPLMIPDGPTTVSAWFSRSTGFGKAEDLASLALPPSIRLAVGGPASGLAGFRRARLDAAEAHRVAVQIGAPGGSVTRYDDVALVALASQDPERAAVFVRRVLGDLAAPEETAARAAETLAAYLAHNRSRKHAAAVLHVHANTVIYRVRQAEQLLGRAVDADDLELRVALALLPAVQPSGGLA
jgi:DNA-binding PucR family transcriptional regulator